MSTATNGAAQVGDPTTAYRVGLYLAAAIGLVLSRTTGETGVSLLSNLLLAGSVAAALAAVRAGPAHTQPFGSHLGGYLTTLAAYGAVLGRLRSTEAPEGLLTLLVLVPTLGAAAILFMPRQWLNGIRRFSVTVMLVELWLSTWLLGADYSEGGYVLSERADWIPAFGIHWELAVDGISLWLVLLTTALTPLALWISWGSIQTKIKEYAFAFLLLEVGMVGAFLALDLFLFYVFWELMLIPMYLIIGVWGGKERIYAAVKFFLYTMFGSLLMLVAILYVASSYHALAVAAGLPEELQWSFSIEQLRHLVLPLEVQFAVLVAFTLAFAIKVPMFPFHTWLPDAHVQAPTGGSVILAAVLLKLGGYGFLRFAIPLCPEAWHLGLGMRSFNTIIAVLAVIGILYGAICAWKQRDVKKLVAYSSVSHLGFVMLGICSATEGGVSGAILQMVAHGVSTGALFVLVGVIYDRRHTRDLSDFGGLAAVMPWYATVFVIVTMSSIGLPGTNGFVGEFMILSGAFVSEDLGHYEVLFTLFAALGVVLAAVYMLHAVLRMFWGPVTRKENESLPDLNAREAVVLVPLVVAVFAMGLFPGVMLESISPAVSRELGAYAARIGGTAPEVPELRGIEPPAPAAPEQAEEARGAPAPAAPGPRAVLAQAAVAPGAPLEIGGGR